MSSTSACARRVSARAAFEIGGAHLGIGQQFLAGAAHRHQAVDHHIAAVGELQRVEGVLLDQEDGQPLFLVQLADGVEDLLDDQRRQPERRLVQQQQLGPRHQRAARSPASAARRPTACRRAG